MSNSPRSTSVAIVPQPQLAQNAQALNVGKRVGRFWIVTLAATNPAPSAEQIKDNLVWLKGQREIGDGGFDHWQFLAGFKCNVRMSALKKIWPTAHVELTRSSAADDYVWKEDTRVPDTQFEYGKKAFRRNVAKDWDAILKSAKEGKIEEIPAQVVVCHYSALSRIAKDFMAPVAIERTVMVFWGRTGTGKSRRAWNEAGLDAYPKDPSTKWWDGYQAQENIVIDEFRGRIAVEHILRWFDRYPVVVETKGGATVLRASRIWITSNISPDDWFPDLDTETKCALRRRMSVIHFNSINDLS